MKNVTVMVADFFYQHPDVWISPADVAESLPFDIGQEVRDTCDQLFAIGLLERSGPMTVYRKVSRIPQTNSVIQGGAVSVKQLFDSLDTIKRNLSDERDQLRDLISEAHTLIDDHDEEIDLLEQCADSMSRYV